MNEMCLVVYINSDLTHIHCMFSQDGNIIIVLCFDYQILILRTDVSCLLLVMSALERQKDIFEECREKAPTAYAVSLYMY